MTYLRWAGHDGEVVGGNIGNGVVTWSLDGRGWLPLTAKGSLSLIVNHNHQPRVGGFCLLILANLVDFLQAGGSFFPFIVTNTLPILQYICLCRFYKNLIEIKVSLAKNVNWCYVNYRAFYIALFTTEAFMVIIYILRIKK